MTNQLSTNAAILFVTNNKRVLFVRDSKNKEWMIPGGKRNHNELDFECALREFREETSFTINLKYITNLVSIVRKHSNNSTTRIFIMHSSQIFTDYDIKKIHNKETDALIYLKNNTLWDILHGVSHHRVKKIKSSNARYIPDLIIKKMI